MIRLATVDDAKALYQLNEQFNGKDETTLENIIRSLSDNVQEVVVVADNNGTLVGFLCVQIKKSFCYSHDSAEITELFVSEEYRRKKVGSQLMEFAKVYCTKHYGVHKMELLTGKMNYNAQAFYKKQGYCTEDEMLFVRHW